MKIVRIALLIVLAGLLSITAVQASSLTYYVSQAGAGTACTLASPCSWSTGQSYLQPGDTLQIVGTLRSGVTFSKSGTAGNPVTLAGGTIAAPTTVQQALLVSGSYVVIRDIEVLGGASFGVRVKGHDVTMHAFSVHDSVWENRGANGCIGGSGGWGRGLTFAMTSYNVNVYDGRVYANCGEGLATTQGHDVYFHDLDVFDNFSRNVYIGNSYNVLLERINSYCADPAFYRNGQPAKGMGLAIETTNYSTVGNQLYNVTIADSTVTNCQGINLYVEVAGQLPRDVTVRNVCFSGVPAPEVDIPGTNVVVIPCGASLPSVTPTSTRTATSTATPSPTSTPTRTLTPTPTPDVCAGGSRIFEDTETIICAFKR